MKFAIEYCNEILKIAPKDEIYFWKTIQSNIVEVWMKYISKSIMWLKHTIMSD